MIMQKKKTYAVFGLGRYGIAVAKELVANGMETIAIDTDQKIVNDALAKRLFHLSHSPFRIFCSTGCMVMTMRGKN